MSVPVTQNVKLQSPLKLVLPSCPSTWLCLLQVVVKTRTEFQTEKKRLKPPKVEEFTISFTDSVSERLKVRTRTNEGSSHRLGGLTLSLLPPWLQTHPLPRPDKAQGEKNFTWQVTWPLYLLCFLRFIQPCVNRLVGNLRSLAMCVQRVCIWHEHVRERHKTKEA